MVMNQKDNIDELQGQLNEKFKKEDGTEIPFYEKASESDLNKAKWFAKQLASLVYQGKAKVLEFPSKKSDTLSETIYKNILSPKPNLTVNGLLIPGRYIEQVTSPDILSPDFVFPTYSVANHYFANI